MANRSQSGALMPPRFCGAVSGLVQAWIDDPAIERLLWAEMTCLATVETRWRVGGH
jgi:hypothetical protein